MVADGGASSLERAYMSPFRLGWMNRGSDKRRIIWLFGARTEQNRMEYIRFMGEKKEKATDVGLIMMWPSFQKRIIHARVVGRIVALLGFSSKSQMESSI